MVAPETARAGQETITLTPGNALRFGTFLLPSAGSREVTANGAVINNGVMPAPGDAVGPAEFTLLFDRGNNGNPMGGGGQANPQPGVIVVEVSLLSVPPVTIPGITGALSNFTTNLPGAPTLQVGQIVPVTITNCFSRICSTTFRIGGKLSVSRTSGGGTLTFSLPLTATLVLVDGKAP